MQLTKQRSGNSLLLKKNVSLLWCLNLLYIISKSSRLVIYDGLRTGSLPRTVNIFRDVVCLFYAIPFNQGNSRIIDEIEDVEVFCFIVKK